MRRRDLIINAGGIAATLSALSTPTAKAEAAAPAAVDVSGKIEDEARPPSSRPLGSVLDPSYIDTRLDSRSVSFENPTGARGGGGKALGGRKGRPAYILDPGEKILLADLKGPGTLRHFWATIGYLSPEVNRAQRLEVFYDGLSEPSISVPLLDFFGLPHGRVAEYYSELVSVHGGRGLNSHIPMPFRHSIRVELTNKSARHVGLFYQIDYTLESSVVDEPSYLHATFRRENPTTLRRDFVIAEGLKGPGRFLGCSVGIRPLDPGWYGEGEVKIYRDGDRDFPTYCGTGLEDYVGVAWGMERHYGPYAGVPLNLPAPSSAAPSAGTSFVSFYRWHLPDPVIFSEELRVTIQQIGVGQSFKRGEEAAYAAYKAQHIAAGAGWLDDIKFSPDSLGFAIVERTDDYCATAFVYCRQPQAVPRLNSAAAIRDIGRLPGEQKSTGEQTDEHESKKISIEMKRRWAGGQ